jgi:ElaB/YqjD/DUF883 family membrane-anchored ribosome-binding protein
MDVEKNKYMTPKQQMVGEPGSAGATAQSILELGAEVYGQAEQALSDVYDKTAQVVSGTYEKAKSYSSKNPGKTLFISLGIGVGLGFLLGAISRPSRVIVEGEDGI